MDNSIRLSEFEREETDGHHIRCRITSSGFPEELRFVAGFDPGESVVAEPNWSAIAMLYPAMLAGRNIEVEADLCARLLHAMNSDLQSLLRQYNPALQSIRVDAGQSSSPPFPHNGRGVATGFSAGVDSFATMAEYTGPDIPAPMHLTHLSVHNVGAFGHTAASEHEFRRSCDRAARVADSLGMKTLFVSSNLDEIFDACGTQTLFQNSHTLRNMAAATVAQAHVHTFLYSSTVPFDQIGLSSVRQATTLDTALLDPMLLPLLSTESITAISSCARLSRGQKTALVAGHALAPQLLDVCVQSGAHRRGETKHTNCSECWKCIRTMATLEALGKLDDFAAVFDVEKYRRERSRFLRLVRNRSQDGSRFDQEVIALQRQANLPLPMSRPSFARSIGRFARSPLRQTDRRNQG